MGLFALLNRLFHHGPAWLTFLVMGMAAAGLALCSFNLLFLFQANYHLLFTYGAMAAFDGGLLQFIELTACLHLLRRFKMDLPRGGRESRLLCSIAPACVAAFRRSAAEP